MSGQGTQQALLPEKFTVESNPEGEEPRLEFVQDFQAKGTVHRVAVEHLTGMYVRRTYDFSRQISVEKSSNEEDVMGQIGVKSSKRAVREEIASRYQIPRFTASTSQKVLSAVVGAIFLGYMIGREFGETESFGVIGAIVSLIVVAAAFYFSTRTR